MKMNKKFSLYTALSSSFKIIKAKIAFFSMLCVFNLALAVSVFVLFFGFVLQAFNLDTSLGEMILKIVQADNFMPRDLFMEKNFFDICLDKIFLLSLVLSVIIFLYSMILIGYTKIALALHDKKKISWRYLYQFYALVPRVFALWMVMLIAFCLFLFFGAVGSFLITTSGVTSSKVYGFLILSIIAILFCIYLIGLFIFIYQRLRFATLFIIDKNLSIRKALQASWKLTQGSVKHLFGFSIILMILRSLSLMMPIAFLNQIYWFFCFVFSEQADVSVFRQMLKGK